jgi:hypothetical protein
MVSDIQFTICRLHVKNTPGFLHHFHQRYFHRAKVRGLGPMKGFDDLELFLVFFACDYGDVSSTHIYPYIC